MTPELIIKSIDKLKAVVKKYDIQQADTFNVDEIGYRTGCIHRTIIITYINIIEVRRIFIVLPLVILIFIVL